MSHAVVAIDLGSTRYRVAAVESDGQVHHKRDGLVQVFDRGEDLVRAIAADVRAVRAEAGVTLGTVGASVCGAIDRETREIHPPNLRSVWGMNFEGALADAAGCPVVADNDANLGAVGERAWGVAQGLDDIVYLTVSTGIGGGIIAGGRVLQGAHGLAGELGHLVVAESGPRCGCGNLGCLEAIASGTAIARLARLRIAAGAPSHIVGMVDGDLDAITAETVADAARRMDPFALELAREVGEALGRGTLSIIHGFDPAMIVFGGSVMLSEDVFFGPVRRMVAENPYTPFAGRTRIEVASLGDDVCLLGAAVLAFDALGVPRNGQ